jgi:hypothetical protein
LFLVAVVLLSALAVPLFGGRLAALLEVGLQRLWAIYAALGLQVAAMELPGLPDWLRAALLVAAYPIGAVFLLANRHLPGMALVALGGALNLLTIASTVASCRRHRRRWPELGWRCSPPGSTTPPPWPIPGWRSSATSSSSRRPGR